MASFSESSETPPPDALPPHSPSLTIPKSTKDPPPLSTPLSPGQRKLASQMQRIAKIASKIEDPWAKYDMGKLKLEKIKRHQVRVWILFWILEPPHVESTRFREQKIRLSF